MIIKRHWLALSATLSVAACVQADDRTPAFDNSQCVRKALLDKSSGLEITGAEDLAITTNGMTLFVSAYDRRSAERAAKKRADVVPSGGLYRIDISDLISKKKNPLVVQSLLRPIDVAGGLRPHGIYWDEQENELLFINRSYQREGRGWELSSRLERVGGHGEPIISDTMELSCAANDVVKTKGIALTSFTHSDCGWRAAFENVFRVKRSGLAALSGESLYDRALYANGVEQLDGGNILLAATREKALIRLKHGSENLEEINRIVLSGGPDNLTFSSSGRAIVALHPSLFRLMFNRKLGIGKSPSRVVAIDTKTSENRLLYDDTTGKQFSAASVAIAEDDFLIIGSATDSGLLVCEK